jgi:hypothetical protein
MARKCIPGTICLENMTLVLFLLLFIVLAYFYYIFLTKTQQPQQQIIMASYPQYPNHHQPIVNAGTPNIMMDPYAPPLKTDGYNRYATGIPVNIETRGLSQEYTQMGILTKDDKILPLMGRRLITGLDKWQYYTISNTGAINTKLPMYVRGRSCSGEYGCDCLMNGDIVFVEGYKESFSVTLYETAKFQYIPYI